MQVDWLFWGIAAAIAAGCLATVFAPLLRGGARADRRASYDMQVHRDQLREIDADLARGVLSPAEAEATRIEVSRRLIAAADAEAHEGAAAAAPRRLNRLLAPAMFGAAVLAAGGLYAVLGVPGLPDQPLAVRQARDAAARANRPGQAEAEALAAAHDAASPSASASSGDDAALIVRLQDALKSRPDDLEGHRLLATSLASLGRWAEARAAEQRVIEILGDAATAKDLVDFAELQVLAAGGYVSPEAEATLSRALTLDPTSQVARYYSALTLLQGGRPDLAARTWTTLIQEGPSDAPWIAPSRAGLAEAARAAGVPPPPEAASPSSAAAPAGPPAAGTPAAGPSAADVDAAQDMNPADRQAMIEGMVDKLSQRLATQGGPPADWAQLIRSLGFLGRHDQAEAILSEARTAHSGDPQGLALIDAAGRDAGVNP